MLACAVTRLGASGPAACPVSGVAVGEVSAGSGPGECAPEAAVAGSSTAASMRTVSANTAVLTFGQLLSRVTGLVFMPFIARHLGSAALGSYNLSNVLVSYFSVIVLFGFAPLVIRDMVSRPADERRIFGESLAARLWLAAISMPVLIVMLYFSHYPTAINEMTLILSVGLFAIAVTDATATVFQARQQMAYSVLTTLSGTAVYLVFGCIALYAGTGVIGLCVANALGMAARAIMALAIVARRFYAPAIYWSWQHGRQLMLRALPFFLAGVSTTILNNIDVAILSHMVPLKAVGYYVAGYLFLTMALYLPDAFAQATYPTLARTASERLGDLQGTTQQFYRLMVIISIAIIIAVEAWAPLLIRTLYGRGFEQSAQVLEIVIWSVVLVAYCDNVGRAIYAAGGQWSLLIVNGVASISNVVLNVALIGPFGIIGASIATVVSFAVACYLHSIWAKRYHCAVRLRPFLWAVPSTAAALSVAFAVSRVSDLAACPLALATYGLCLVVFRVLREEEIALLRSLAGRVRLRLQPGR